MIRRSSPLLAFSLLKYGKTFGSNETFIHRYDSKATWCEEFCVSLQRQIATISRRSCERCALGTRFGGISEDSSRAVAVTRLGRNL